MIKLSIYQYQSAQHITMLTHLTYQPCRLQGILYLEDKENSSWRGLLAQMPSAIIPSEHSYSALPLARQLIHHRFVLSGPLVLGKALLNFLTPTTDRDRTVSRRSEPSSRAVLMGEQPNPWKRFHLQDTTSRHRGAKPHRLYELLGGISLLSPG